MDGEAGERGKKLNWRQACEILGCGRGKFYALVHSGKLCAFKVDGSKRGMWVWEEDVKELVKGVVVNA